MDLPYPSKGNSYPEASLTVELMFSLCVMATGRVVENLIDSDGTCLISGLVLLSIPSLVRLKLVERSRIQVMYSDDARTCGLGGVAVRVGQPWKPANFIINWWVYTDL